MSKPRSKLFPYAEQALRTVRGYTTAIHFGRQSKHMPGHPNHDSSKSPISAPLPVLQQLLDFHAGTGRWFGKHKEVVDFGTTIGNYSDPETGEEFPTTVGTIHYSKSGAHVVPTSPRSTSRSR